MRKFLTISILLLASLMTATSIEAEVPRKAALLYYEAATNNTSYLDSLASWAYYTVSGPSTDISYLENIPDSNKVHVGNFFYNSLTDDYGPADNEDDPGVNTNLGEFNWYFNNAAAYGLTGEDAWLHYSEETVAKRTTSSMLEVFPAGARIVSYEAAPKNRIVAAFHSQAIIDMKIDYFLSLLDGPRPTTGVLLDNTGLLRYPHKVFFSTIEADTLVPSGGGVLEHPTNEQITTSDFQRWYWYGEYTVGDQTLNNGAGAYEFLSQLKAAYNARGKLVAINAGKRDGTAQDATDLVNTPPDVDFLFFEFSPSRRRPPTFNSWALSWNSFLSDLQIANPNKSFWFNPNGRLAETQESPNEIVSSWAFHLAYIPQNLNYYILPNQFSNSPPSATGGWLAYFAQNNAAIQNLDIGAPLEDPYDLVTPGTDGAGWPFRVIARQYEDALVVSRELASSSDESLNSYTVEGTPEWESTAMNVNLPDYYYKIDPATLENVGEPTNLITLRNGEGFILRNTGPTGSYTVIRANAALTDTLSNFPVVLPKNISASLGPGPYAVVDDNTKDELPANGMWFKATELYGGKSFRVYATAPADTNVFSADWTGVYSFEENPQTGVLTDRSPNGHNKTAYRANRVGWDTDTRVDGVLGKAWSLDSNDSLAIRSQNLYSSDGTFTFASWVNMDGTKSSTDFFFQSNPSFWMFAVQASDINLRMQFQDFDRAPPQDLLVSNVTDLVFDSTTNTVSSSSVNFESLGFQVGGLIYFDNLQNNSERSYYIREGSDLASNILFLGRSAGDHVYAISNESGGSIDIYKGRDTQVDYLNGGIPDDEWHHIAFAAGPDSTFRVYYDGQELSPYISTGYNADFSWDFHPVGGPSNNVGIAGPFFWNELGGVPADPFDGYVDEFMFIDEPLSAQAVEVLYKTQLDQITLDEEWWVIAGSDAIPPRVNNAATTFEDSTKINIKFIDDSGMDLTTMTDITNYSITPSETIISATAINSITVQLEVSGTLNNAENYTVVVTNVNDAVGNTIENNGSTNIATFQFYSPNLSAPVLTDVRFLSDYGISYIFDAPPTVISPTGFKAYLWDGSQFLEIDLPNTTSTPFLTNSVFFYKNAAFPNNNWFKFVILGQSYSGPNPGSTQTTTQTLTKQAGTATTRQPETPPTLASGDFTSINTSNVYFSEAVDSTSAVNQSNWDIFKESETEANAVSINSITWNSLTDSMVSISTENLASDTRYVIQMSGVTDTDLVANIATTDTVVARTPLTGDLVPPDIVSIDDVSATQLLVIFDQSVDAATATNSSNYNVYYSDTPGVSIPISSVTATAIDRVTITIARLVRDSNLIVSVVNVQDLNGNPIPPGTTLDRQISISRKPASMVSSSAYASDLNTVHLVYDENLVSFNPAKLTVSRRQAGTGSILPLTVNSRTLSGNEIIFSTSSFENGDQFFVKSYGDEVDSDGNVSIETDHGISFFTVSIVGGGDTTPPSFSSINAISSNTVRVVFNEPITKASAENTGNWTIGGVNVLSAIRSTSDSSRVDLTANFSFASETTYPIVANSITDIAGNQANQLSSTFISGDYEAPFIATVFDSSYDSLLVTFNEVVNDTTASVISNYRIWLSSSNLANDPVNISSVTKVDSVSFMLVTAVELSPDTEYTIRIISVEDVYGNSAQSETSFFTSVALQQIRVTFTNSNNIDVDTVVRAIVPFELDAGPPYPTNDIRLYEYSLEDANGNPELAEFSVVAFDPADSSVTQLAITAKLAIPANSSVEKWFTWGASEPNLPLYTELIEVTQRANEAIVNNNKLTFTMPNYRSSPASDMKFADSNKPAIRESFYELDIAGIKYVSYNEPIEQGFTQGGYIARQYYINSFVGPLQLRSYVDVFLDNNFVEVETVITNNTLNDITIGSLKLNWPIQGKFRTIYYNGGDASSFTPGQYSGLAIRQNSAGYAIVKDNTTTLVDGTGQDYSSWIASLSNNGRWYTAIIPGNISRTNPRTLGRVGENLFDQMINENTVISAGETKTFTTVILLEEAPVTPADLNKIKVFSIDSGVSSDVTPTYREDRDLPPTNPYDKYELEQGQ